MGNDVVELLCWALGLRAAHAVHFNYMGPWTWHWLAACLYLSPHLWVDGWPKLLCYHAAVAVVKVKP